MFVDLASISAGENDMDVDRVACFHDAVLGYSSMLYELKPDSGFHVFKEVLKKLWRALENDSNLPKKLVRGYHGNITTKKTIIMIKYHNSAQLRMLSSFLAGQCTPFGMAEDCEGQSWVSGAVISLFSINHQQQGLLHNQCTRCKKGK